MIYAIGDSFTEGAELNSVQEAWPYQLGLLCNKEIINQGKQGTGNTRIVKRTIDAVLGNASMIIIGWSDPARIELADEEGIYDIWPARVNNWNRFDNIKHRSDLVKLTTLHDSPKFYYANWLRQIILLQTLCKSHGVKCLMFIAYNTNRLHNEYCREFVNLITNIDISLFVNKTMSESTSEWTYGAGKMPNGHPSALGHKIISQTLYEYIRTLGWIS